MIGTASARASAAPATRAIRAPASAAGGRPITGAATKRWPASPCIVCSSLAQAGEIVVVDTCTAPRFIAATSPSLRRHVSIADASSNRLVMTTDASAAAAAGVSPTTAPSSARGAALSAVRL